MKFSFIQFNSYAHAFPLILIGNLWYVSGSYFIRRWKAITISTLIIALFSYHQCNVQLSSIQLFFLSFIPTLVCNMLDHLDAVLDIYPELVTDKTSQIQTPYSAHYWSCMVRLLFVLPCETDLNPEPIDDLYAVMQVASARNWQVKSLLYPTHLRPYLCTLAAFSRLYDDLIDDSPTEVEANKHLALLEKFVGEVFIPSEDLQPLNINWEYYRQELPTELHVSVYRNMSRMSHFIRPSPMFAIINMLKLDIANEPKQTVEDLKYFGLETSGSFIEMCTCVLMYKSGYGNWALQNKSPKNDEVLRKYRTLGGVIMHLYRHIYLYLHNVLYSHSNWSM